MVKNGGKKKEIQVEIGRKQTVKEDKKHAVVNSKHISAANGKTKGNIKRIPLFI
jgi:hypothetical protein